MLNAIDFQLCADETQQRANEAQLAPIIFQQEQQNLQAFKQYIPQIAAQLKNYQSSQFSPFVTRDLSISVMNVLRGRSLYPLEPASYCLQQVADFCHHALVLYKDQSFATLPFNYQNGGVIEQIIPGLKERYQPIENTVPEHLVILGCGLGHHLLPLAQSGAWQSILLVEPEFDLLKVSTLSAPWDEFLCYCHEHHIELNIQADVPEHDNLPLIEQWAKEQSGNSFHLFCHYQHPVFSHLEFALATGTIQWNQLTALAAHHHEQDRIYEFRFPLTHFFDIPEPQKLALDESRLAENRLAFERFMPEIAQSFSHYHPQRWLLFQSHSRGWNMLDLEQGHTLYLEDAQRESLAYLAHYAQRPKLDALDARSGTRKPSPYLHYEYSDRLKALVQALPNDNQFHQLPKKLPSFILYGMGIGFQLETLCRDHEIDNLIIYEPHNDYFYASLWLIDWQLILTRLDRQQANLYLNIGDNGEHMVEDILNRLNYSGIHILSYTFFYISYYQLSFDQHIRHTREHFKILLNISEYYDHAFYNFTQTYDSFAKNYPYLLKAPSTSPMKAIEELPVFIVGNGPSLDYSIETLREYQNKAIIISCGTSLKALYKYGIKPDFHAEVEQTRSTFHWINQVSDKAWLKQIDLLTVNGVHPDVAELFRTCLLSFKQGESATLAHLLVNPQAQKYQSILYSYPTVSNCAIAYALALGFKQLYLFGVDLGFKDPRYHHSQQSAYFKEQDGQEIYDYSAHGVGLRVPGNFDDYVFTKYEFRYSSEIISKTLQLYSDVDCYNTSNGSLIEGTMPLHLEQLLILNGDLNKEAIREQLITQRYDTQTHLIARQIDDWFDSRLFDPYIRDFIALLDGDCQSWSEVLEQQKQQMILMAKAAENSHSLFFVLMRGTTNYCLTYLTRLAFSGEDEALCMERYRAGKAVWKDYLLAIQEHYQRQQDTFDQTPSLAF